MLPKWFLSHYRLIFRLLLLTATISPLGLNYYVNAITSNRRYTQPEKIPAGRVAIVFGAGIYPDGTLSPMLSDRVSAAVELYKLGRVQKLLMTGDNSRDDYNEVQAMQNYAVERGVPAQDITLDYAGFSTYESCYRAKDIFGIKQAVLVTQKFHLPRAVYTCDRLGVKAIGLGTPDWESYSFQTVMYSTLREELSTLKALWEVNITRPQPTFLGSYQGIK
ncbi:MULTISPECIES: vancomycin high temperature exclusion protein [Nostoc]|uniref:YdcF family protein n=1 Tax=Nostoc paludosum FACHB-159 TaxID=2692908 RepID=A0ABR8KFF7_9NOSO|nr:MULTISPECIES: ElyC/SanA/YdcF family protein [Nostoc]MBD2680536.1 YdcF family protein [Nostoc sp. FACHB-857]MBD2736928.1 YdcF family protein [Nostoc paludosum FACHB-159]